MDKVAAAPQLAGNLTDGTSLCPHSANPGGVHGDAGPAKPLPLGACISQTARTLSTIRLRSTSATAPSTVKIIFPVGVLVFHLFRKRNKVDPRVLKVSSARTCCAASACRRRCHGLLDPCRR